jgi:hypothetical protein
VRARSGVPLSRSGLAGQGKTFPHQSQDVLNNECGSLAVGPGQGSRAMSLARAHMHTRGEIDSIFSPSPLQSRDDVVYTRGKIGVSSTRANVENRQWYDQDPRDTTALLHDDGNYDEYIRGVERQRHRPLDTLGPGRQRPSEVVPTLPLRQWRSQPSSSVALLPSAAPRWLRPTSQTAAARVRWQLTKCATHL